MQNEKKEERKRDQKDCEKLPDNSSCFNRSWSKSLQVLQKSEVRKACSLEMAEEEESDMFDAEVGEIGGSEFCEK